MAADANSDIDVSIVLDQPTLSKTEFGTLLLVFASGFDAGFTERTRTYASAAEASNDAHLSATMQAAVAAVFSQTLKPTSVKIGRADQLVANVWTVQITAAGDDDDTHTIKALGTNYVHTKTAGQDADAVAAALQALVNDNPDITATVDTDTITLTGDNLGQELGVSYAGSGTAAATATEATPAVTYGDELAAIAAEDDAWYGLHLASREAWAILQGAVWIETQDRLQIAQSSDADILTNVTTDIGSVLKAANYQNTALLYYSDDAKWAALCWATNRLSVDPDGQATTWNKVTLVGVTTDTLTTSQKVTVLGKNVALYLPFFGTGATVDGKTAKGAWIDEVLASHWLRARTRERLAALVSREANAGRKLPYTDRGIQAMAAVVRGVLADGEEAGHFLEGAGQVDFPTRASLSADTINSRHLTGKYGTEPAGAIHTVSFTGYIQIGLELLG